MKRVNAMIGRMKFGMWLGFGIFFLMGWIFLTYSAQGTLVALAQSIATATQTMQSENQTPLPSIGTTPLVKPAALWPPPEQALTTTGATPPPGTNRGIVLTQTNKTIVDVPAYLWHHGCGPTVAGMVLAYWDKHGYDKLLPADPSTQTEEVNEAIASIDHYNDYSLPLDDNEHSAELLPDKSEDPIGDEHPDNSIADFMKTSQSVIKLRYGWSSSHLMAEAYQKYIAHVAPDYAVNAQLLSMEDSFSWEVYKKEIDAGRPMMLVVDTDGDNQTDHAVAGIGYQDDTEPMYGVYDTWDTEIHWYTFKKMELNQEWGIYGALLLNLGRSFQVNSTEDLADILPGDGKCETQTGVCTLRAAIQESNTSTGYDIIRVPAGTYALTLKDVSEDAAASGDLDILEDVSILGDGKGATIIDGSALYESVFSVGLEPSSNGSASLINAQGYMTVVLDGLTIQGGKGGINAWGIDNLVIENCAISDNQGPGVWAYDTALVMRNCFVNGNIYPTAVGGVYAHLRKLTLEFSTISGNSGTVGGVVADGGYFINASTINGNVASSNHAGAELSGGGVIQNSTISTHQGNGLAVDNNCVILNSTITANQNGIYFKGNGVVALENNIVNNNQENDLASHLSTSINSNGYNLIGKVQEGVFTPKAGDLMGSEAKLGVLQNNGGTTSTHALLFSSPAIDAANPLGCTDYLSALLFYDQRLMTRPMDGNGDGIVQCDMGAYEVQSIPNTPTVTPIVTAIPTGIVPTLLPTMIPTGFSPTLLPTMIPTGIAPTLLPTLIPTGVVPTLMPTMIPTGFVPTLLPTMIPTAIVPTLVPTAVTTPTLAKCYEAIINGGFEKDEAWYLPVTMYSAGYDSTLVKEAAATYSSDEVHSGSRSMRTGIVNAAKNIYSYSSSWQQLTIPSDAQKADLTFWNYSQSINGIDGYDVQMMIVLNQNKQELQRFVNDRSDARTWKSSTFDLKKFAAQTIWVYFGVYNNGWGGVMGMYVDDVSLTICKP